MPDALAGLAASSLALSDSFETNPALKTKLIYNPRAPASFIDMMIERLWIYRNGRREMKETEAEMLKQQLVHEHIKTNQLNAPGRSSYQEEIEALK
jgi:hypothetical protein